MGDLKLNETNLIIPHYDLENRDFFLLPLLELDPSLKHPLFGIGLDKTLEKLSQEMRTTPMQLLKFAV